MGTFKDLTGRHYGKLMVLNKVPNVKDRVAWNCKCECGNEKVITAQLLRRKSTRSCSCLFKDWAIQFGKNKTASGDNRAYHPLYNIYNNMHSRCYIFDHHAYKDYGGRGIKMCKEWRIDFWKFVADVGERPSKDHTLDRINNDGNYEPTNIRWATWKEQAANRRNKKSHIPNAVILETNKVTETLL